MISNENRKWRVVLTVRKKLQENNKALAGQL